MTLARRSSKVRLPSTTSSAPHRSAAQRSWAYGACLQPSYQVHHGTGKRLLGTDLCAGIWSSRTITITSAAPVPSCTVARAVSNCLRTKACRHRVIRQPPPLGRLHISRLAPSPPPSSPSPTTLVVGSLLFAAHETYAQRWTRRMGSSS